MNEDERKAILSGVATIYWGLAWADHVDEADCYSLAGRQIEKHMPAIPKLAHEFADKLVEQYEKSNGAPITDLLSRAKAADGLDGTVNLEYAERFGECLVYEAQGHGVSWTDDHAAYEHVKVYADDGEHADLMWYAEKRCEHCKK